ncbi:MAG: methyltransferase domain-containing protein [Hungatella sp.]|nr:methyltransferase domain-containing protein [Hungatella sp.]
MTDGYYTSGEFAKKARVTIRTIRFYDKQGILKPSKVNAAGYRLYTDEDFGRLQKILSLKYLGFSLEEIMALTINDDREDMANSLKLQKELIRKRIRHLEMMEQTLEDTSRMVEASGKMDWNSILNLIHITNMEHAVVDQYKTAVNINARIQLHQRFSHNPVPWFSWIAARIPLEKAGRILEVGCGNGQLWQQVPAEILKKKEVHVTDVSSGMVEDAAELLRASGRNSLIFETEDCQKLSYGDQSFDVVIANHVLFYVKNLPQALGEIHRVLRPGGSFYCSTYGRDHMKEITLLVQEFDPRITLSEVALYELFGLENGGALLEGTFDQVEKLLYRDYLLVDEPEPLLDYILSCHGNQSEILSQRQLEFKRFLQKKIQEKGGIRITKMAGIFVCRQAV